MKISREIRASNLLYARGIRMKTEEGEGVRLKYHKLRGRQHLSLVWIKERLTDFHCLVRERKGMFIKINPCKHLTRQRQILSTQSQDFFKNKKKM